MYWLNKMFDHENNKLLEEIIRLLRRNNKLLEALIEEVEEFEDQPVRAIITQGRKTNMSVSGTIKGLAPGASDSFFATPVDANGNALPLPAGSPVPVFTADDPSVVIVNGADGLSAVVTAAPTATLGGFFNLNWSVTLAGASAPITGTANVPYLPGAPPPPPQPVGAVLSQGSPAV